MNGGYLLRGAQISGSTLALTGDVNRTTTFEVVGTPNRLSKVTFNGKSLSNIKTDKSTGAVLGSFQYHEPRFNLPDMSKLKWKTVDSLPEIKSSYDDSKWTKADHTYTNNTETRNLTTPTSLYCSDYGYNGGSIIYRGHFQANGSEKYFYINTQGGNAYGSSIWLGDTFLGSNPGSSSSTHGSLNFTLSGLTAGKKYIFTVLIDHMGNEESGPIYSNTMKTPRGILDYTLGGRNATDVAWKITGNLGGENYKDRTRGPLNEGAMYAERQGWHLPKAPTQKFASGSPLTGMSKAGVSFYL